MARVAKCSCVSWFVPAQFRARLRSTVRPCCRVCIWTGRWSAAMPLRLYEVARAPIIPWWPSWAAKLAVELDLVMKSGGTRAVAQLRPGRHRGSGFIASSAGVTPDAVSGGGADQIWATVEETCAACRCSRQAAAIDPAAQRWVSRAARESRQPRYLHDA